MFSFPVFLFSLAFFAFTRKAPASYLRFSLSLAKPRPLTCVFRFHPQSSDLFLLRFALLPAKPRPLTCVFRFHLQSSGLFLLRSALFPAKLRPFSPAFRAFSRKAPASYLRFSLSLAKPRPFSLAFCAFTRKAPASYLRFFTFARKAPAFFSCVPRFYPQMRCSALPSRENAALRLKRRCISPEGCRSRKIPLLRSAARHPPPDPPSPQRP